MNLAQTEQSDPTNTQSTNNEKDTQTIIDQKQMTKDEKRISSALDIHKKSPYEWTCDEVVKWMKTTPFAHKRKKFRQAKINGSKLFSLDRLSLQNEVKIFDPKIRTVILKHIQSLKNEWRDLNDKKTKKWLKQSKKNKKKKSKKHSKSKKNKVKDIIKNRIYLYINRNQKTITDIYRTDIDNVSNYSIQHILDFYDLKDDENEYKQQRLEYFISIDMQLIDCLIDQTSKDSEQPNVFAFILLNRNKKYIYLMTQSVLQWDIENVSLYFSKINHSEYDSFSKVLKYKNVNGSKLMKYTRKTLQIDYLSHTSTVQRKQIYDEIQILNGKTSDIKIKSNPKTYHNYTKRTQSEIERQKQQKQKQKKLGPRDIGKNKHYKGINYSLTDDYFNYSFLSEHIHPTAQHNNFMQRKQQNPISPKQTVQQIGNNKHYKDISYSLSQSQLIGCFLDERIGYDNFEQRKYQNPIQRNQTVEQIGHNKHYKSISFELRQNSILDLNVEKIHHLANDENFQQRKLMNPISKNQTVEQIGNNKHYKDISYSLSESQTGFLEERVHPLAKDNKFQQRKQQNPLSPKESISEINMSHNYIGIDYKIRASEMFGGFLNDKVHPFAKDTHFMQRKLQNPIDHKQTVEEIGMNKDFEPIVYSLSDNDIVAGCFLEERIHPLAKEDNFQQRKQQNPIHKNKTVSEIGRNKHYKSISYELLSVDEWKNDDVFEEKLWFTASKVNDNNGLSWLMKHLPSHKLRIMDKLPLPTGKKTKIVWLAKLRDLVSDEMTECAIKVYETEREKRQTIAYSVALNRQLTGLTIMLQDLESKK